MPLLDRRHRRIVTHRIACGRPGRPPMKLDHLEITTNEQLIKDGPFVVDNEAMLRLVALGERYVTPRADGKSIAREDIKPRRIPIRCPDDDIDSFLVQRYESRRMLRVRAPDGTWLKKKDGEDVRQLGVWCAGDGVTARRLGAGGQHETIPCCSSPRFDDGTGFEGRPHADVIEMVRGTKAHDPRDGKRCPFAQNHDAMLGPICRPTTEMFVHCDVVANLGALCRVRSHAHSSADGIRQSLEQIKARMPGGMLRNVPLDLVLQMRRMGVPNSNATALQPELHIELRLDYDDTVRLLTANLQQQLALTDTRKLLLAAKNETATDDEVSSEWPQSPIVMDPEGDGL